MRKVFLIFFFVLMIFVAGCVTIKDCGADLNCFKENAKTCSRSKVDLIDEDTNLRVTIRGNDATSCKISFKIDGIGENSKTQYPTETRIAVGKTMNCKVDKRYSEYEQLDYIDEIFNLPDKFDKSCTGPLKDLMQGPLKETIVNEFKTAMNEENLS